MTHSAIAKIDDHCCCNSAPNDCPDDRVEVAALCVALPKSLCFNRQALQRMQQRTWSHANTASSATSSFDCNSFDMGAVTPAAATPAAPHRQRAARSAQQPATRISAEPGNAVSSISSEDVYAPKDEETRPIPPQKRASIRGAPAQSLSPLQRVDSLEQLEASCRGMAGILQQDAAAAEQHGGAATAAAAAAGQSTAAAGSPGAPATGVEQPPADSEPPDSQRQCDNSDTGIAGGTVPGRADGAETGQKGSSRRGTDASVAAENAFLRQELSHLRSEHVTARIKCDFMNMQWRIAIG